MKYTKTLLTMVLSVGLALSSSQAVMAAEKRILMVVSGHGLDRGKTQPGYEFDEFAQAYLIFKNNEIAVDVVSPKGGKVEADHFDDTTPYNRKVLDDSAIMTKLNNTQSIGDVTSADYDAVFIVGGKGAMFDLPKNKALQNIIANIYQNNGPIAAVCHGPAALVNVTLKDGSYLVAGKAVNGFTNLEENVFGKKWLPKFDFLLEDKLQERGGLFEKSEMMMSHVAIEDRLITGQNPSSTPEVAEALVRALGIEPKVRPPFQDEITLKLISRLLNRDTSAVEAYKQNSEKYNAQLIGMYGYYRAANVKLEIENPIALSLMEMVSEDMKNPRLDMAIAKGYLEINQIVKVKTVLEGIIQNYPDFEPAQEMLQTL